jgi:hypothetical protein
MGAGHGKRNVVLWGGGGGAGHKVLGGFGSGSEVLSLVARDSQGATLANTRLVGPEPGHPPEAGGLERWYLLYEVEAVRPGLGTLKAVDAVGNVFAAIDFRVVKSAVIVVPSQGVDRLAFDAVARQLRREVYEGNATIVRTTVHPTGQVTLTTLAGKPFSWGDVRQLSSVLVISHGGYEGPNLATLDESVAVDLHQALGKQPGELSEEGKSFWRSVGGALDDRGKIILLGCHEDTYGQKVAGVALRRVFGPAKFFEAGDERVALRHVKAIEGGTVLPPMRGLLP